MAFMVGDICIVKRRGDVESDEYFIKVVDTSYPFMPICQALKYKKDKRGYEIVKLDELRKAKEPIQHDYLKLVDVRRYAQNGKIKYCMNYGTIHDLAGNII